MHGRRWTRLVAIAMLGAGCGGSGGGGGTGPQPPPAPPDAGLDARPQNLTCVAPDRTAGNAAVTVVDAFPALPAIGSPTKLLVEPVADPRWFVLRKTGRLVVFDPDNATAVSDYLVLTVNANGEGGLLGMAFHPDYPATPEIFLSYTRNHSGPAMRSVVSRFVLDNVTAPGAGTVEEVILEVDQDFSNHNGGDIAFGADGYLYLGLGDGGSAGDPNERAQDTRYLLGSFLRIDVLAPGLGPGNPYAIPLGNPFAGNSLCGPGANANDCPEIFAWGVRNPWRWSFDPATGVLWAGDVGQGEWEEIDRVEVGGNYGWDCREGAHDYEPAGCAGTYIDPVAEYPHTSGNRSITGGYVYRGSAIPGLAGRYVFADFESGRIWALQSDGQGGFDIEELASTGNGPSSFGVDQDGELYYTDYFGGRIMKLVPAGAGGADPVPEQLADSGCVAAIDPARPYSGLLPYDINAPFWSDGAAKERFIAIPDGTAINAGGGDWVFPPGTVLVKNFRLNGRLVETRHLMRHPDGAWAGYTYEWNAGQTGATRVRGGKTVQVEGQAWIFPDEAECLQCHTAVAGVALGPETAQLNKSFTYPSTGRTDNQLDTLDAVMMFAAPLPGPAATLPALADPGDASAALGDRARSYLHSNCAQCHRPGGPTPVSLDLRADTLLTDTNACDAPPQAGDLGLPGARIIAPGNAAASVLVARMARRDSSAMPPLGSALVDAAGVGLVSGWIDALTGCN